MTDRIEPDRSASKPADGELAEKLSESKKELFNIRFQEVTGQANAGRRRTIKRDIARIYTVLRERELGIRPATEGESK